MLRFLSFLLSILWPALVLAQDSFVSHRLDSLRSQLLNAPVQEKAYLHLDNTCYFKGDTLWYKAYVVRADQLSYTDISRILYVELLTPDGLLVERQNHIISADGLGDGCFVLHDSLYSGYYELRAYTRWMLNFNVRQHPHTLPHLRYFFSKQMAEDFFREYDGLCSRVVPVYERPSQPADYDDKKMLSRPKVRLEKEPKPEFNVTFYPEGGHLLAGTRCTVAFEVTDELGQGLTAEGKVSLKDRNLDIKTQHQGRGAFTLDVPSSGSLKARFVHRGKEYDFDLPDIETRGCALRLEQTAQQVTASIALRGLPATSEEYAVAVLCRGRLHYFRPLLPDAEGNATLCIPADSLPTGVNDLVVTDAEGTPLADRLFFVRHADELGTTVSVSGQPEQIAPLQPVSLTFQTSPGVRHLSIAIRDRVSDEPTFDTGTMLTDLLLSSELRGFVANPDYYFACDDAAHRQALDHLMLVQGWRRYDYQQLVTPQPLRYEPELCMTVTGWVNPTVSFAPITLDEVTYWQRGVFLVGAEDIEDLEQASTTEDDGTTTRATTAGHEAPNAAPQSGLDLSYEQRGSLRHEVTVLGELVLGDEIGDVQIETTDGGHFAFNVPPFYGEAVLFLRAQKTDISNRKAQKLQDRGRLDETQWPEFYVKRDLIYPVFSNPYNYYQCHQPELDSIGYPATTSHLTAEDRISTMDSELDNVEVRARRRRGSRAIDYTKPAFSIDAYELYNLATDRGLSFGKLNFREFPHQIARTLFGNWDTGSREPSLRALFSGLVFYQTDTIEGPIDMLNDGHHSNYDIWRNLFLNRIDQVHVFSDFELRNYEKPLVHNQDQPDVTIDFVLMPNDTKRYSYRDRRIRLQGFHMPTAFYSPDYSLTPLPEGQRDVRRTLYWNPNAPIDSDGRFVATFYNNSTATDLHVSVAGLSDEGVPAVLEQ